MLKAPLTETEIEDELDRLKATPTQRKLMRDMGDCLATHLELPNLVMRGFYLKAVTEWQKHIGMTAAESEVKMSTEKKARVQTAVEILAILRKNTIRMLKVKGLDHLLDDAIDAALKLYTEKYASRPPDIQ